MRDPTIRFAFYSTYLGKNVISFYKNRKATIVIVFHFVLSLHS